MYNHRHKIRTVNAEFHIILCFIIFFLLHKLLPHKLLNFAIYRTVKFNQGAILKRESPLTS